MWWHHKKIALVQTDELGLLEGELARVVGRAVSLGAELEATHTGRKCLAVRSTMEQHGSGLTGSAGGVMPRLDGPELVVRFAVDDGTGRVVVAPQAIKLELELEGVSDPRTRPGAEPNAAPRFGASIINRELRNLGARGDASQLSLCEGVLVAGDMVAIIGRVKKLGEGWELVAAPGEPLIVSTHPDQLV